MSAAVNGDGDKISITSITCGSSHSVALLSCGIVASWGRGEDGQLGHGDADERLEPTAVSSLTNAEIDTVVCGAEYTIAVSKSKTAVYSWGWGDFGRLGHGNCNDVFIPQPISFFSGMVITRIACGDTHSLAITEAGELFSFGRNQNGQLGLGHNEDTTAPALVEALQGKRVSSIACGAEHSIAATEDGKVYGWGWGRYGNLGDGECQDRWKPADVKGLDGQMVTDVACGWRHSAAITSLGEVFTFGWSKYGQLGHGDSRDRLIATQVAALKDKVMVKVAGGWRHTMAADDQGTLYAWGWNKFGQLGLGDCDDRLGPCVVKTLQTDEVKLLACGWRHTLAVTKTGQVYSWGRGVNGQLGHADAVDLHEPTLLTSMCEGTVSREALLSAAAPMNTFVAPSDRFAVVPNHDNPNNNTTVPTVPAGPDAKRARLEVPAVPE